MGCVRAKPKSVTTMLYCRSSRIFSHFKSLCTTPRLCRYSVAQISCLNNLLASSFAIGPRPSMYLRRSPEIQIFILNNINNKELQQQEQDSNSLQKSTYLVSRKLVWLRIMINKTVCTDKFWKLSVTENFFRYNGAQSKTTEILKKKECWIASKTDPISSHMMEYNYLRPRPVMAAYESLQDDSRECTGVIYPREN